MRIVCLSDTHMRHKKIQIPDGDVLVHAGDFTTRGSFEDIIGFNSWLGRLPHKHKVIIAGNHDFGFERDSSHARSLITEAIYLEDSGTEIDGVRFWGSPWQPWFYSWAFNLRRGAPLAEKWALIPTNTDVLITHGPPFGILDQTDRGEPVGCEELKKELHRVRPKLHVFGHIHEAYGQTYEDGTTFVNASNCTLQYKPDNAPIVVDIEK